MNNKHGQEGYIALISAIIISSILLVVTVTLSYTAFFARYNILDSEYKERSASLAEACADVALLKLANNSGYAGNVAVAIGTDFCSIRLLFSSGTQTIVDTQASFQNAYTNLRLGVATSTLTVMSWEEIPKF